MLHSKNKIEDMNISFFTLYIIYTVWELYTYNNTYSVFCIFAISTRVQVYNNFIKYMVIILKQNKYHTFVLDKNDE